MRPVQDSDFDTIFDIYMDETVNPFMWHDPMDKKDFRAVFDKMMFRDYFWIFQDDNGRDCAMACVILYKGRGAHIAEIQSLGIKKENQNKGMGKIIMRKIVSFLKERGMKRIQLFAEADNERGLYFYNNLGFQEEGRMKHYLKRGPSTYVDEVVFAMIIES